MAPSLCPRPNYLYGSPGRAPFLNAVQRVRASAVLQCLGDDGYQTEVDRNRARIAALQRKEMQSLNEANHAARIAA
jgi:hypothetical protein